MDKLSNEKVKKGELLTFEVRVIRSNGKLYAISKVDKNTESELKKYIIASDSNTGFEELKNEVSNSLNTLFVNFNSDTIEERNWKPWVDAYLRFKKEVNTATKKGIIGVPAMTLVEFMRELLFPKEDK